jgi:hypothetical protein
MYLASRRRRLGVVLDHNEKTERGCVELLREMRDKEPRTARYIASLCFVNDEAFPGVQAADMALNLTRRALKDGKIIPSAAYGSLSLPIISPWLPGKSSSKTSKRCVEENEQRIRQIQCHAEKYSVCFFHRVACPP